MKRSLKRLMEPLLRALRSTPDRPFLKLGVDQPAAEACKLIMKWERCDGELVIKWQLAGSES